MGVTIFSAVVAIFYISSGVLESKPCNITSQWKSDKSLTGLNASSDGFIVFYLLGNQDNCTVDLDLIFGQMLENVSDRNQNKTEVFKEFDFFCDKRMAFHFISNNTNVKKYLNISVAVVFGRCHVYLKELQLFLKYGNIWSITQSNDSVIHLPSQIIQCPFAKHLRMVSAKISCDTMYLKQFFWELCEDIFEKLSILQLTACKTNRLDMKRETLVQSFPKLQSLILHHIHLATQMTFPWTRSFFDAPNQDLIRFLSNEKETTLTKTAMGRGIKIFDSNTDIEDMLHLTGDIALIVINDANLKQIKGEFFKNVSHLYTVDLSFNNLTEINELLFDQQSQISDIHLKHNKLNNLPSRIFERQIKLVFLDLSGNCLTEIDRNLLRNLRSLQELRLEENQIQHLPQGFLKEQIHSLKYLYLHSNLIMTMPEMPFYGTKLKTIDLHGNNITGESILDLVNRLNLYDFIYAGVERAAYDEDRKVPVTLPKLDLSYCKIRDIRIDLTVKNATSLNFLRLFKSFNIKADGNPLTCRCEVYFIVKILQLIEKQGVKHDWKCMYPEELSGMLLTSITERDVYCPLRAPDCPLRCACYERIDLSSSIVDCRNINITTLPKKLPERKPLELWLKNTSLSVLSKREYFLNVSVLDISESKLTNISPVVASQLKNVDTLKLENNYLTSLPVQIKFTNISRLSLDGNAFVCDCHTIWMLNWLHDRLCPVTDWNVIKCTDNKKNVREIIKVPDYMFVCNEIKSPSIAHHVILPSILIGSVLFVIVVLSLLMYIQRHTVKVLLYIVCGFRGCINLTENLHGLKYDCVVIYAKNDQEFIENSIIKNLQGTGYNVADMYKNSVVGFTFVEGIRKLITKSRRVIFCMTGDISENELITTLWNIAYDRAMISCIGSIILIIDNQFKAMCDDENIKVYLKNGRYINIESRLLLKSVEYLMPPLKQRDFNYRREYDIEIPQPENNDEIHLRVNNTVTEAAGMEGEGKVDIYIMFPDELHRSVRNNLIPFLRENKQNVSALQDDIIFGSDIREITHLKLDIVKHVIFIVSNDTLITLQTDDHEGDQLRYILPNILNKAFVCSHNYLLLFTDGLINVDMIPSDDLKKYLNTYVTASVNDLNFKERLLEAVMIRDNGTPEREDTDSLEGDDDVDAINLI